MTKFSDLEKKKVEFKFSEGRLSGTSFSTTVVGCDLDIGISIIKDEGKTYCLCLNGPSSPLWTKNMTKKVYKEIFKKATTRIQTGIFDVNEFLNELRPLDITTSEPVPEDCPFGQ